MRRGEVDAGDAVGFTSVELSCSFLNSVVTLTIVKFIIACMIRQNRLYEVSEHESSKVIQALRNTDGNDHYSRHWNIPMISYIYIHAHMHHLTLYISSSSQARQQCPTAS